MITTIITGLYMWLTIWRGVAWILVVLGALILEIVLFVGLTRPRMAVLEQVLAAEKGTLSQNFHSLANHSLLWISAQIRIAVILAIVFLKIAKPDLGGSLLTVGIAILLGLASAIPIPRRERAKERPAG
jgi:hypothetical protein